MVIRNKIFCKKNGLDYIYLYDLLGLGDLDGDGLHPNPRGYKKIFERARGFGRKYYFLNKLNMTTIEIEEVINIKSKFRTKEELFEYLLDLIESEELGPILTQIKKEKDFISEEEFLTNY